MRKRINIPKENQSKNTFASAIRILIALKKIRRKISDF